MFATNRYPKGWNTAKSLTLSIDHGAQLHVSLTSTSRSAVPLKRPENAGVEAGYWQTSYLAFWISPDRLAGRYQLEIPNDARSATISCFAVELLEVSEPARDVTHIFSSHFAETLRKGALLLAQMYGRWTPPGQTIYIRDGKPIRASTNGNFVPLRADFGKSRLGKRNWQHPDEIDRIVALQKLAERLLQDSPESDNHRDRPQSHNQAEIERWIANKSGIWSPGTVHLQLQIARNKGKITPKRRGRKRPK